MNGVCSWGAAGVECVLGTCQGTREAVRMCGGDSRWVEVDRRRGRYARERLGSFGVVRAGRGSSEYESVQPLG